MKKLNIPTYKTANKLERSTWKFSPYGHHQEGHEMSIMGHFYEIQRDTHLSHKW